MTTGSSRSSHPASCFINPSQQPRRAQLPGSRSVTTADSQQAAAGVTAAAALSDIVLDTEMGDFAR